MSGMMDRRFLLVALFFAFSAEAATAYRVRIETNEPMKPASGVRVTASGDDVCIETEWKEAEPKSYTALTSADGGASVIAINHENQTWYPGERLPLALQAWRCGFMDKNAKVGKVKWLFTSPEDRHYVATLSFTLTERIDGHKVDVTCTAALDIQTTGAHPRSLWPAKTLFETGHASVDAKMAGDLATIEGFPTRIALTFFRQFKGGAQYKHKTVLATEDVRTVPDRAVPACARPAHYREQRPVVLAPGVVAR